MSATRSGTHATGCGRSPRSPWARPRVGRLSWSACAAAGYAARQYALGLGLVYVVVAIWGFIIGSGDSILSIVPVNTSDNILHLILGLTGLAAGAATPASVPARTAPA